MRRGQRVSLSELERLTPTLELWNPRLDGCSLSSGVLWPTPSPAHGDARKSEQGSWAPGIIVPLPSPPLLALPQTWVPPFFGQLPIWGQSQSYRHSNLSKPRGLDLSWGKLAAKSRPKQTQLALPSTQNVAGDSAPEPQA